MNSVAYDCYMFNLRFNENGSNAKNPWFWFMLNSLNSWKKFDSFPVFGEVGNCWLDELIDLFDLVPSFVFFSFSLFWGRIKVNCD